MKAQYCLERWDHGWLVLAAPGEAGIPMDALSQIASILPKKSGIDAGIAHHYRTTRDLDRTVLAIGAARELEVWRALITKAGKQLSPELRWWTGVDVGLSSAAIFAVFCNITHHFAAKEYGHGETPRDAADFGRCLRLLAAFPEWRANLHKVAEAYPETLWPKIIARWEELETAEPARQTEILRGL